MEEQIAEMIRRRRSDIGAGKLKMALEQTFHNEGVNFVVVDTFAPDYSVSVYRGEQYLFTVRAEAATMKKAA